MTDSFQCPGPSESSSPHEGKITVCTRVAWICVVLGVLAAIPGVWVFCFEVGSGTGQVSILTNLSSLGSYLQGAVQSLWSLAAFLFIYVAFLGQKQQLKLQSDQFVKEQQKQEEQLRQQQMQLEDQRKQFQSQQGSIERQNFENSFFQLLGVHNQIVGSMETVHSSAGIIHGRRCFAAWFRAFTNERWGMTMKNGEMNTPEETSPVRRYMLFYNEYQTVLGHYFRNLYHVIKFVKESDALKNANPAIEYKNRRRYTSLVRATLSQFELALLFYNGLSPTAEKFKPLIEEFGLFENLDLQSLAKQEDTRLYHPNAFLSSEMHHF
jgi:hypothetical protein